MNVYEIKEALKKSEIPVFTSRDIARIAGLNYKEALVYINRMVKKGIIQRIAKGYYAFDDDPFVVASYIVPNSYISFNAALYLHRLINQVPQSVEVVTPTRIRKKISGVRFVQLPKAKIFGFRKQKYKQYQIYVAEKEKAVVDIIYKYKSVGKELIRSVNTNLLKKYAKKMGASTVKRLEKLLVKR